MFPSKDEFVQASIQFFKSRVYLIGRYGNDAVETLADAMIERKRIPSVVSAQLVWAEIESDLFRIDGKTVQDDAEEARVVARANLNQVLRNVAAPELTKNELDEFASLSKADLARLYWGVDGDAINAFACRYRKAAAQQGFVLPPRPSVAEQVGELELTAAEYHRIPANAVAVRLQRDFKFRAAVEKLIANGEI